MNPKPAYPTRQQVDPSLLSHNLPANWKPLAALAVTLIFAGCDKPKAQAQSQPATQPVKGLNIDSTFLDTEFRGAFGCVAITPPVYLSEEDALNLIQERFQQAGIKLEKTSVKIPTTIETAERVRYENALKTLKEKTLEINKNDWQYHDGIYNYEQLIKNAFLTLSPQLADRDKKVAILYLNDDNSRILQEPKILSLSKSYDFVQISKFLAASLKDNTVPWRIAVFYSPLGKPVRLTPVEIEQLPATNFKELQSKDLPQFARTVFQEQLQSFGDWLKKQESP